MDTNKRIIAQDGCVILRELMDSDVDKITDYANNEKISINLRDAFPHPYTISHAIDFIKMVNTQNLKTFFAIEYKGEYVGNIGLSIGEDVYRKSAEIGYFIGEPLWGRGIATRAISLLTDWGFENLDIVRIHAGVFEFNKASQRVLEKCGYQKEGVFKNAICKANQLYDEIRYAKIKE